MESSMKEQWKEWIKTAKETDKKVWIVTAAILLVLAAVMLAVVRSGGKAQEQNGLCPYRWEQKDSGELELEIDTSAVQDAVWSAEFPENAEEIIGYEIRKTGNKVRCTIRGTQMGGTQLTLLCRRTAPVLETVCRIEMSLGVQEDLSVEMTGVTETEEVCFQQVEAQNMFPCYYIPYTTTKNTALEIRLLQVTDDNWEYHTEGDVAAGSAMRLDGICYLEILAGENHGEEETEAVAVISNTAENIRYTFVIAVMPDGTLQVKEASAGSCEAETEEGGSFTSWDSLFEGAGE